LDHFYYCIRNREGKIQEGRSLAEDREEVVKRLIEQGCWVLDVSIRRDSRKRFIPAVRMWPLVSRQELTWFFRQLSSLIAAGVPLLKSLETLQEQASSRSLKAALSGVVMDLKRGESLANALIARDEVFPLITARMIGSGEAGGALEQVLQRVSAYLEKEQEMAKQVKSAALYPVLLAGFAFGVVLFLVGYVVPRLTGAFHYDISTLPVVTRVMLGLAAGINEWIWPSAVLIAGVGFVLKWYRGTPAGRFKLDRLLMTLPLVGSITRKLGAARFTYNMGILVQSGLGVIETLEVCETAADSPVLAGVIRDARHNICRGRSIADSLKVSGFFDPLVIQMVTVGEETGKLDESLLRVAGYYEAETEHLIKSGITLLEPFLIIIMALVVGVIVCATILPMLDMMTVF